jgi:dTDP-4-dehydrorhamnose 3,5-epimerase/CDP-3, 6-dideoxy-D-glycero-D-glycero-4-hexulose-5-epimerase
MKVEDLQIIGSKLIKSDLHTDKRGFLYKPYSSDELRSNGIEMKIAEILYSYSKKNVIRGMHFQTPPNEQKKIVHVIKGKIIDVLLDLRINSNTYQKHLSIDLGENDGKSIFIPNGVAHGFRSLEEGTMVIYFLDSVYYQPNESGIRYDSFDYDWNIESPIVSERDKTLIRMNEYRTPFKM